MTKTWWLRSTSFASFTRIEPTRIKRGSSAGGSGRCCCTGDQDSPHLPDRDAQLWCNGSAASTLITHVTHCVGQALTQARLRPIFSPLTNSGQVDPSCTALIFSLMSLEFKPEMAVPDPNSDHGHMSHALGYASLELCMGLSPSLEGEESPLDLLKAPTPGDRPH